MMAHAVIPHHDHEEETSTEHHNKDHNDDDDDFGNLFSHFQHVGLENQVASTRESTLLKQIDIPQTDFITNSYNFYFSEANESVPILFPEPPDISSSSGTAAFSLRGPPSITV